MLDLKYLPIALTALRVLLAPVVIVLAIIDPEPIAFGICLVLAFVSDIFDGIIARRLNVATPNLRRLDSLADSVFYVAATLAAWYLHPSIIADYSVGLIVLGALEVVRYIYDLRKFGREASYHMWSSKLWGIALFAGFFSLLVFGSSGIAVAAAIYLGIIADVEGLAISIMITQWQSDVPSVVHAYAIRNNERRANP